VLVFEPAIRGQQRIDLTARAAESFAVFHACPTQTLNGVDVVSGQVGNQIVRKILVKQNAHGSEACRARAPAPRRLSRVSPTGTAAGLVERVAWFEVVEQPVDGHARADKHAAAALTAF
jgi:hypothetical protein